MTLVDNEVEESDNGSNDDLEAVTMSVIDSMQDLSSKTIIIRFVVFLHGKQGFHIRNLNLDFEEKI